MYELKYKITFADMEKVNKSIMWAYFIPYMLVACAGLAVGIVATVTKPSVSIMVLGIILMVLGAILAVCAILLAILPKGFVMSALIPDDDIEHTVKFDDGGITASAPEQSDITFGYGEIVKIKNKKDYLLLYFGKDRVLLVKNALTSGTLAELAEYIAQKINPSAPAVENPQEPAPETDAAPKEGSETAEQSATEAPKGEPKE